MTELDLFSSLTSPTEKEMADYLVRVREGMITRSDEVKKEQEARRRNKYVPPDPAQWRILLDQAIQSGLTDICIAYCRVSSAGQEQNHGMEAQRRSCTAWAALNRDRGKVDLFIEDVNPGSDESRAGIAFLMEAFLTGKIAVVICYRMDRIARSQYLSETIKLLAEQNGVELVSATENLPENGFLSDMFRQVLAALSEYESSLITQRMTASIRLAATVDGVYIGGHTPYGYRRVAKKLEIEESEAHVIRLIFVLYAQGYNGIGIAEFLNRTGIPTRYDSKGWTSSQAINAIKREAAYRGEDAFSTRYFDSEVVVFHKAILPHRAVADERTYLYNKCQTLPDMTRVPDAFLTDAPYLQRRQKNHIPTPFTYAEASALVQAYQWHLEGMIYRDIVDKLNALAIPPLERLRKRKWSVNSIRQQFGQRHRWAPEAVAMGIENASIMLPEDKADLQARIEMEREAVERIHALHSEGLDFRTIARTLAAERLWTMSKRAFDVSAVLRVVKGTERRSQTLIARMEARGA